MLTTASFVVTGIKKKKKNTVKPLYDQGLIPGIPPDAAKYHPFFIV